MNIELYQKLTTETLQEILANARHTAFESCGHMKSNQNLTIANEVRGVLARRGIVPDGRVGVFNGLGTW